MGDLGQVDRAKSSGVWINRVGLGQPDRELGRQAARQSAADSGRRRTHCLRTPYWR